MTTPRLATADPTSTPNTTTLARHPTPPRVVYATDYGGWFRMTPRAWAAVVRDALADPQHEWDLRRAGSPIARRPRSIRSIRMDTVEGQDRGRPTYVRDDILVPEDDVAVVHPRDDERDDLYWRTRADEIAAWGLGAVAPCMACDACRAAREDLCERPHLVLADT